MSAMKPDAWMAKWSEVGGTELFDSTHRQAQLQRVGVPTEPLYTLATVRKWLEEEPSDEMSDAGYSVGSECPICIRPNYSIEGAFKAMLAAKLRELEDGK